MAFLIRNLSVLCFANGFTLWHYKCSEDDMLANPALDYPAKVTEGAYFSEAETMMTEGDIIIVSTETGSARMLCVDHKIRMNENVDLMNQSEALVTAPEAKNTPVGNPTRSFDHSVIEFALRLYLELCVPDDQIRGLLGTATRYLIYGAEDQVSVDRIGFDIAAAIARRNRI